MTVLFGILLSPLPTWALDATLSPPPGAATDEWEVSAAQAGLTLVAPGAPAALELRVDGGWALVIHDPGGRVRTVPIETPHTASNREELAYLAASLLRPIGGSAPWTEPRAEDEGLADEPAPEQSRPPRASVAPPPRAAVPARAATRSGVSASPAVDAAPVAAPVPERSPVTPPEAPAIAEPPAAPTGNTNATELTMMPPLPSASGEPAAPQPTHAPPPVEQPRVGSRGWVALAGGATVRPALSTTGSASLAGGLGVGRLVVGALARVDGLRDVGGLATPATTFELGFCAVGGWEGRGALSPRLLGEVGAAWRRVEQDSGADDSVTVPVLGVSAELGVGVGHALTLGPQIRASLDLSPVSVRIDGAHALDLSPVRAEAGLVIRVHPREKP